MSLFASAEQGTWYDPSDLSSMFQDSAGTTPVTAVEQAVGLILDKSKGLVLGSELVSTANTASVWGAFGTNTATQDGDAVKIMYGDNSSGGFVYLRLTSGPNLGGLSTNLTIGRTYRVTAEVQCNTGGLILVVNNGSVNAEIAFTSTSYVTYTFNVTILAADPYLQIRDFGAGEIGFIRNISVRELTGNHAIQPSAASRPILRARYNQLTYSEQFDNAAWAPVSSSITANQETAPDGTVSADLFYPTATGNNSRIYQDVTVTTSQVFSVYAKAAGINFLNFRIPNNAGAASVYFNLSNGTVSSGAGTITSVGNGWYRCSASVAASGSAISFALCDASGSTTVTANGTNGIYIWGADVRRSNDTYLPYQRIAAATVYDTVGFPTYLSYDGSDDSMYTGGNLDLSGTDKVTVFAGVTKLSDATQAPIAELGPGTGDGVFFLFAPRTNATADIGWRSRGTATAEANTAVSYAAPLTAVLTAVGNISGDSALLRSDAVQVASSTADQGTGNYASAVLNMGRRNNASLPFNGRLYSLIVRGAATSAALITQTERWVAGKQGRTL